MNPQSQVHQTSRLQKINIATHGTSSEKRRSFKIKTNTALTCSVHTSAVSLIVRASACRSLNLPIKGKHR